MAMPLPILAPSVLLCFRLFSIWFQVSWRFATTSSTFDAMGNVRLECESVFNEVSKENVSGIHHLLVILRCCTNLFNWFVQVSHGFMTLPLCELCVLSFHFIDARWASMMNTYKDGLNQVKTEGENLGRSRCLLDHGTMRPSPFFFHAFFYFPRSRHQLQVAETQKRPAFLGAVQLTMDCSYLSDLLISFCVT